MSANQLQPYDENKHLMYNHTSYALYLVAIFTSGGLLWLIPIFMNYLLRAGAEGSWLHSHYNWQISTFWSSVIFVGLGWLFMALGGFSAIGALFAGSGKVAGVSIILLLLSLGFLFYGYVWNIYRVVKGWIALADKREV